MKNPPKKRPGQPRKSLRFLPLLILGAAVSVGILLGRLTVDSGAAASGDAASRPAAGVQAAPGKTAAAAVPVKAVANQPATKTVSRVRLDLGGAPSVGRADAPVTLVEFVDYQCPFCRRAHPTVTQIMKRYGDKVRFVFLQNPLPFHKDAPLAAHAALAAAEQGRFEEMHELIFSGKALKRADFISYARKIGLDTKAFEASLDSDRLATRVKQDQTQAARVGASATPFFFINGRSVRGARPLADFTKIIDEELQGHLPPTQWIARVPAPASRRPAEDPNEVYAIDLADSIARGPADAPVTMVEFTAFQCGFCKRSQPTIQKILQTYPDDVRLMVKYMPLRDHKAAIASLAAHRQGKYWEYRKLLFDNQRSLSDENLRALASQVGLNLEQFEKDRQDPELAAEVQRNVQQARSVGVQGTPTFFINGKKLVGAQPFTSFKTMIDQQLAQKKGANT
ncbi:MAG: DsbA family protein [Acidobacteriota bacterium]